MPAAPSPASEVTDEEAYTSLLEICTELIISEGTDDPPVHRAIGVLHGLLHCDALSGDATVLSVRAVRILLEKFTSCLKAKSRAKLVECVRAALRRMKVVVVGGKAAAAITFVHTKSWELKEELLQCMAAAAQSDESVRAALPPLEEQVDFCIHAMDVSLDMCLQALRMCSVVVRSGQLGKEGAASAVALRIRRVLREKLHALESMEVNQDWLRLLRHLTDGLVTMRAYASSMAAAAATAELPTQRERKRRRSSGAVDDERHRPSSARRGDATPAREDAHRSASSGAVDDATVWLRLCQKICAIPRLDRTFRSTVFSCAGAVLAGEPSLHAVPAAECVAAVVDLAKELSRNVRTTLCIANPFLNREAFAGGAVSGGEGGAASAASNAAAPANPFADMHEDGEEDEEQGEDLLNNGEGVKWQLPDPEWPLLWLISMLLSADATPSAEYMWWWIGDDEYARRFGKEDRAQLARAFFAAQDAVLLKKRSSKVQLSTMREIQWPFLNVCRVVFQPVPCGYAVDTSGAAPALRAPPRRLSEQAAALRACDLGALLDHLSAVSRYDGTLADYGRTVLLNVLLLTGPQCSETTRSALRNFLSDASTALIEKVSEAFLRHDRAWATPLMEVGVTETILRRSTSNTPERSPVVRMLRREAASLPPTPPLLPRTPEHGADPAELRRILQCGSRAEVKSFLVTLVGQPSESWNTASCAEAVAALAATAGDSASAAEAPSWVAQVEHVLTAVVVKHLQEIALQCLSAKTLKETVEEAEIVEVELCSAALSPAFCCPRHHPLRHHHSKNWVCDVCKAADLDSAWSCRQCDYDVCVTCARGTCNRLEGAVTATAQDVLAVWRSAAPSHAAAVLFTESGGVVSAATPLACLHRQRVHVAELCASCACGLLCPGPSTAPPSASPLLCADPTGVDLFVEVLRAFGATCGRDTAVQRCLLKAYESAGMFVFFGGAGAVPAALRRVLHGLAPHLPLPVKHFVARYLAVECRRYAFAVLHDQTAVVMSTVTGVTAETAKGHKIEVPREDKAAMLRVLHDSFRALLSPVLRVAFTFAGEVGFGSGPTQELYTELSAHFRGETRFWFVTEDDGGAAPVVLPFPSTTALFLEEFFVLGAACGRAFVDHFRMNMPFLPEAWALLKLPSLGLCQRDGTVVVASAAAARALDGLLAVLDPALHRTFAKLRATKEADLAAMALEMEDGTAIASQAQLEQHIEQTLLTRYEVAMENLRQFQWGLLSVIELDALSGLSDAECSVVLCGADTEAEGPLFTEDELRAQTTVGNGYSSDSPHVEMFLSIVGGELTRAQQHHFLEFLTGSPRMPLDGLSGLGRLIMVAMKDMEDTKEMTLPSCNTCFLYLKLPPYSTREIMKARLLFAITEGRRNYSLS